MLRSRGSPSRHSLNASVRRSRLSASAMGWLPCSQIRPIPLESPSASPARNWQGWTELQPLHEKVQAPMTTPPLSPTLLRAHAEFEELVKDIRPELHRYCARMIGSVVDAEDVVQDALAKAYYALPTTSVANMRAWLFRIAHNKAIDHLRRASHQPIEQLDEYPLVAEVEAPLEEQELVALALSVFLKLAPKQRSCVILKDVMGYSLAEISELLDATVPEIKAALHRGRERLRELSKSVEVEAPARLEEQERELLARYIDRFNARDFDAVRA